MRNMGIAPFNIASSVILITAQRLARRLCLHCKAPADIRTRPCWTLASRTRRSMARGHRIARWLRLCNNGYKGRVGIYQVMPISRRASADHPADGSALRLHSKPSSRRQEPAHVGLNKVKLG
jgi:type IV pilus assembly protein PilB